MITYWLMFLVPALLALNSWRPDGTRSARFNIPWALVWGTLTLLIGFRFRVGGDWIGYNNFLLEAQYSFDYAITATDPAYGALNWISGYFDWNIYGVNLVCGAIFAAGLMYFCRAQPLPWLALTVAIPYLVIVVAMGYSRQGVAIGLAMVAFLNLAKRDNIQFMFWLTCAALFHKSAIVLIPIALLVNTRNRWWSVLWIGAASALLYALVLEDSQEQLFASYIELEQQSEGATVRVFMNAVPALIFLLYRKHLVSDLHERRMWFWIAAFSVAFIPLLALVPSTAVDRIALYFIPLQLFAWSRLPRLSLETSEIITFLVIAYSAAVQFVWLNYAIHAPAWIPYRFYPFEILFS